MDLRRRQHLQVLQAQAGERVALGALLAAMQGPLHRYLRGLLGGDALADDVLQDVFVTVHRKLTRLHEPAHFRAWIYRHPRGGDRKGAPAQSSPALVIAAFIISTLRS